MIELVLVKGGLYDERKDGSSRSVLSPNVICVQLEPCLQRQLCLMRMRLPSTLITGL